DPALQPFAAHAQHEQPGDDRDPDGEGKEHYLRMNQNVRIATPISIATAYWLTSPDCMSRTTPENQPTTRAEPFTISPSITVWSTPRQKPRPTSLSPPAKSEV